MCVRIKRSTMQARFFALILQFGLEKVLVARRLITEKRRPSGARPPRRFSSAGYGGRDDRTGQPEQEEETNKDHISRIINLYWIAREMKIKFSNSRAEAARDGATSAVASFCTISRNTLIIITQLKKPSRYYFKCSFGFGE